MELHKLPDKEFKTIDRMKLRQLQMTQINNLNFKNTGTK